MDEPIFVDGMRFEKPREGTPEFIKGKISIKVEPFLAFINEHQTDTGWINIDLKRSKGGKLYLQLNTYRPKKKEQVVEDHMDMDNVDL